MTFLHRGVVVALDPGQRSRLHAWVVLSVSSCVRFSEITCVLQRHCSVHRSHGKSLPRENIKCFSADQTDWTWAGIFTCTASALPLVDEQWTLRHTHIICNRDELPIVYAPVIYPLTEIITSAVCCICYTFFHSRLTRSILLHIIHFIPTLLCCRLFDCGVNRENWWMLFFNESRIFAALARLFFWFWMMMSRWNAYLSFLYFVFLSLSFLI